MTLIVHLRRCPRLMRLLQTCFICTAMGIRCFCDLPLAQMVEAPTAVLLPAQQSELQRHHCTSLCNPKP